MAAAAILTPAILMIGLILAGVFDPKPLGLLVQTDHLSPRTLTNKGENVIGQPSPWPGEALPTRFSVRLSAAHADGDMDSGYGLVVGDETNRLLAAVSPLGYVAVREESGTAEPAYALPWQPWPHVRTEGETNEIWLDIAGAGGSAIVTVQVNREYLWQGEVDWSPEEVGLWLAAFDGGATTDFQSLEWFTESGD